MSEYIPNAKNFLHRLLTVGMFLNSAPPAAAMNAIASITEVALTATTISNPQLIIALAGISAITAIAIVWINANTGEVKKTDDGKPGNQEWQVSEVTEDVSIPDKGFFAKAGEYLKWLV